MILYFIALLVGIDLFINYLNPPWSPLYCDHFSGNHSNAWGPSTEQCEKVGCKIKKLYDYDTPNAYDADGYAFKCVRK
jgi:hypothetical protein